MTQRRSINGKEQAGNRGSGPRTAVLRLAVLFAFMAPRGLPVAYADFDDLGAGARAIGMGNAFTAIADDVFGMYYNPAGLAFVRTGQIGADFGKLYAGLDDGSNLLTGFTAVAFPIVTTHFKEIRITTVTVAAPAPRPAKETVPPAVPATVMPKPPVMALPGISSAPAAALPLSPAAAVPVSTATVESSTAAVAAPPAAPRISTATVTVKEASYRHNGTVALGWRYFTLTGSYQESTYYLGYGRTVNDRWAWGVTAKYLSENYVMDEYLRRSPVFNYGTKNEVQNMSVDAGVMVILAPRVFLGIAGSDLNQPNLGLKENDMLPATGRVGIAWKERDLTWAVDGAFRRGHWYYAAGFEKMLAPYFTIRSGLGLGERNYCNLAAGFSVNFYRAQMDYVFQYPMAGIEDTSGTHRLSILFRFGRRQKDDAAPGSLEYYYEKMEDELARTRRELADTKSEKENLEKVLIEEATMRIQERIKAARAEAAVRSGDRQLQKAKNDLHDALDQKEAESRESRETRHLVRKGETLQLLAERYYGDVKFWNEIYQANRDAIGRGGVLKPGQLLAIPSLAHPETAAAETPVAIKEVTPIRIIETPKVLTAAEQNSAEPAAPLAVVPVKIVPVVVNSGAGAAPAAVPAAAVKPAATAAPKPRPAAGPRRHIVQPGESLRSIAQKYYNDSDRWKDIYKANRAKIVSGQVKPGQEIDIP